MRSLRLLVWNDEGFFEHISVIANLADQPEMVDGRRQVGGKWGLDFKLRLHALPRPDHNRVFELIETRTGESVNRELGDALNLTPIRDLQPECAPAPGGAWTTR